MENPILHKWKIGTIKIDKRDKRRNLYLIKINDKSNRFLFHFIKTMPEKTKYMPNEEAIMFHNDWSLLTDDIKNLKIFVNTSYLRKNEIEGIAKIIIEKQDCKIDFKMLNDILLAEDI